MSATYGIMQKILLSSALAALFAAPPYAAESTVYLVGPDAAAAVNASTIGTQGDASLKNVHYVKSTAASDGSGTYASPWKTLSKAGSHTFAPGDILYIEGDFSGQTFTATLQGTASAPITIIGHDASGTSGYAVMKSIYLSNATYANFTNINAGWSSTVTTSNAPSPQFSALQLLNTAHHLTFTNMQLHDAIEGVPVGMNSGTHVCNNITFNNLSITRMGNNGLVYADLCGDDIHINGGSITYTGLNPQYNGGVHGIYSSGGHSHEFNNITFAHNING